MKIGKKTGFTLVEILIVVTLLIFILYFAYQIFFSQTRAVTQTIDALQTNEGLRRVLAFVGDDVRESTRIVKPTPIKLEDVPSVVTTTGNIMILQSSEVDPRIKFDSPLGGQISQITTIEYDYPTFHLSMRCYWCTVKSGNLVLKEHEAARWLTKEQLNSVDWLPADLKLIGKCADIL